MRTKRKRHRQPNGEWIEYDVRVLEPSRHPRAYLLAALDSLRRRVGDEATLDDFLGPGGNRKRLQLQQMASSALSAAWDGASRLMPLETEAATLVNALLDPITLDPVVGAVLERYPAPDGADPMEHVRHVVGLHRQIANLETHAAEPTAVAKRPRGRGRPTNSNPWLKVALRALIHWKVEVGDDPFKGWNYVRRKRASGKPTDDADWQLDGAAKEIVELLRKVGIAAPVRTIAKQKEEYRKFLQGSGRSPRRVDYVQDDLI